VGVALGIVASAHRLDAGDHLPARRLQRHVHAGVDRGRVQTPASLGRLSFPDEARTIKGRMVNTIEWTPAGVVMIDQRILPAQEAFITCKSYQEVADAIRSMVIRGAPAIGCAAAMGVAIGAVQASDEILTPSSTRSAPRWRPRGPRR
jgi:hypothetical protein